MRYSLILLILLVILPTYSFAQSLGDKEKIAVNKLMELRSAKNEGEIKKLHADFKLAISDLVHSKGFFDYALNELKIADIKSADKTVRLLTWNVELTDLSNTYGGFVLRREEGKDRVSTFELNDVLDPYSSKPENVIDYKNWYGAIYYKIIDFAYEGKVQYLLFGFDAGTTMSNYKILDVLSFTSQNAKFGSPVFRDADKVKKRVVFEYANMASMSLEFEPKRARIVFDHLSPESSALEGVASYYFPDMSYDAYVYDFDREIWQLQSDVIATNPEDVGERYFYALNKKTGKIEKNRMRSDWVNPTDQQNLANGGHTAALPEPEINSDLKSNKKRHFRWKLFRKPVNPESY